MKLDNGKRLTVIATTTRKADHKDTVSTLRLEGKNEIANLINNAITEYNATRKECNADKTLGKIGLRDAMEQALNRIVDLDVQTLAKQMSNAGSVNDFLFNVISANTITMDKDNNLYYSINETIVPNEQFIEKVKNPTNAVRIGTVDFRGQKFINFETANLKAMVLTSTEIPETVRKEIVKMCDNPLLSLFEGKNQNIEFKESLEKFSKVIDNFESTLNNVCRLSETGEFVSITKRAIEIANNEVIEVK